jgi:hypothetical protein
MFYFINLLKNNTMKKASLLFVFALISLYSHAQYQPDKIKFGLKAGFNVSLFTRDIAQFVLRDEPWQNFNRSVRGSFTGGLTVDINMARGFSLGTEVLFSSRGMSYREENERIIKTDEEGREVKVYNYYNYNVDFMELPVALKYNFKPESSRTLLIAYAGISQAVLVNHKAKLSYPRKDDRDNEKSDLENVHRFNKNLIAGMQIGEKEAFGVDAYFDLRGSYSLSPVFNKPEDSEGNNLHTRMWTIALTFGVKF